ncbi:MAG: cadherin-like domain-containing protein [Verrucomicrobiaceae bacterium]|nr:cadherin-like domain-containing protein [Verrucomicrobiaceae bacterium]
MKALFFPLLVLFFCSGLSRIHAAPAFETLYSPSGQLYGYQHGVVRLSSGVYYGTATYGGTGGAGSLFSVNRTTQAVQEVANFAALKARLPRQRFGLAVDGSDNIYGVLEAQDGTPVVWKWSVAGGLVELGKVLDANAPTSPRGGVVWDAATSTLWGVCEYGGADGEGVLWKWTSGGGVVIEKSFSNADPSEVGTRPTLLVMVAGELHGVCVTFDSLTFQEASVLWKRSPSGDFSTVRTFDNITEGYLVHQLIDFGGSIAGFLSDDPGGYSGLSIFQLTGSTLRNVGPLTETEFDVYFNLGTFNSSPAVYVTTQNRVMAFTATTFHPKVAEFGGADLGYAYGQPVMDADGLHGMTFESEFWTLPPGGTSIVKDLEVFDDMSLRADFSAPAVAPNGDVIFMEEAGLNIARWSPASGQVDSLGEAFRLGSYLTATGTAVDYAGNAYGTTYFSSKLWRRDTAGVLKSFALPTSVGESFGNLLATPGGVIFGQGSKYDFSNFVSVATLWKFSGTSVSLAATLPVGSIGGYPTGQIALGPDGAIYGTNAGYDDGTTSTTVPSRLWKWDGVRAPFALHDFPANIVCATGLAVGATGTVYGMTTNGDLWEFTPGGSSSILSAYSPAVGKSTSYQGEEKGCGLVLTKTGKLYGITSSGGSDDAGTLWVLDTTAPSPTRTVVHNFLWAQFTGRSVVNLTEGPDGMIYGVGTNALWRYGEAPAVQAPAAFTGGITNLAATTAQLHGNANARGSSNAVAGFDYGLSATALTNIAATGGGSVSGTTPQTITTALTGLLPNKTYFYRSRVTSDQGTVLGELKSFKTTAPTLPVAKTTPATSITVTGATLNGSGNAKNTTTPAAATFVYGWSATTMTQTAVATPGTVMGTKDTVLSAAVTGLAPHTKYFYQTQVSGPLGSAKGAVLNFTTGNTPPTATADTIGVPPGSTIVLPLLANDGDADGDTLSVLSFTAPGTAVGTLKKVPGGLSITTAAGFTSGSFNYTVTDGYGGTSTATVTLNNATASVFPTLSFPATGGIQNLAVNTSGLWSGSESSPWLSFLPGSESGNGFAIIQLTALPNTSATQRTTIIKVGGASVTVNQNGVNAPSFGMLGAIPPALVSTPFLMSLPINNAPVTYSATGLPKGLKINPATNVIEGSPEGATVTPADVTITAKNAAGTTIPPLTFQLSVAPLPSHIAGNWTGLLGRAPANSNLGGILTMTVSLTGNVSGSITSGLESRSFTSRFIGGQPGMAGFLDMIIQKKNSPDWRLRIWIDQTTTNQFTATLQINSGTTDFIYGYRDETNTATLNSYVTTNFNVVMTRILAATATEPRGHGLLRLTATNKGAFNWKGKAPDGTPLTGSFKALTGGWHILRLVAPDGKASLQGQVIIQATNPNADTINGTVSYQRNPSTGRVYPAGFPDQAYNLQGRQYQAPTAGNLIMGLSTAAGNNAFLDLTHPAVINLSQALRVNVTGLPVIAVNPKLIKFTKLNTATGELAGTFRLISAGLDRTANFECLIRGTQAPGQFIINDLPVAGQTLSTSPLISGTALLRQ